MRPLILDPLFRSIRTLGGIGPKNARLFEKLLGGERIIDLLWHRPIDIIDRSHTPALKDARPGQIVTTTITIQKHSVAPRRGIPSRVTGTDGTATLDLVFFNAYRDWLEKTYPIGEQVVI